MIVITGATGHLGQHVVHQLLAKVPAREIAVVVRNASKAADLAAHWAGVDVRIADYGQPATLDAAFGGAEKVLLISGSDLGQRIVQHQAVIDAAKKAGARQLAYTSILNADTTRIKLAVEHQATEKAIKSSGLAYTLLRNGWYTENYTERLGGALAQGAIFGATKGAALGVAPRADYAAAAVAVLTGSGHDNRAYELAGPSDFTLPAYAAEISRLTKKEIPYNEVTPEALEQALVGAGFPPPFAALFADSDVAISRGELADDSGDLARLIGRPTIPWRETLAEAVEKLG